MSGGQFGSLLPVRPTSPAQQRAAAEWAEAEVLRAMPDATRADKVAALTELLDCLGLHEPE